MYNRSILRWATLLLFSLLIVVAGPAFATGAQEDQPHDEHEHDEDHADTIPHIEPIVLGEGERIRLVVTTNILGDVVRQIAGTDLELTVLMAEGQNPHSYEPTPAALATVESAHIVFTNGLGLEENLIDDLDSIATGYVVPVSVGIVPLEGGDHDHEDGESDDHEGDHEDDHDEHAHEEGDPHVWTDPNNALVWVENIVAALSEADPQSAEAYRLRGDQYIAELLEIDAFIRESLRDVPRENRKVIVDHDALAYFADEYGIQSVGAIVPGTTDTAEPSARDVARLVEVIRAEDVRVILVGRTASRALGQLAETVAQEAGGDVRIVSILTGALAPAGQPGDTYLGFLRYNAEQIARGLIR